ncbi:ThiF family adenylyltransferase [Aeromicrobium sp. CnD17-E]|uniref:ThiF family adenylyltransferase n=2 Tax=unclassified Aeromicrobium TaxID=2633570 RepID=UPI002096957D|nr:ThiF family adenylyltransferase [Aeromicrobium sp. CnD17-E]MDR6117876.1 molybdopterin/thiamine biosynthesis adenylyltransferase [Aeromicrobium sp. SORGH_AS_0981]
MTGASLSVAMTAELNTALRSHLLRPDGDEDICLATYSVSTGARRVTHLIDDVLLPGREDRIVHGNATIRGEYVLREATAAAAAGRGLAILHSHPRGRGWQQLSRYDHDAERSYATLVREVTGLPLIGLTLAGGDGAWSARSWDTTEPTWSESVRVVGGRLEVSWNDALVPKPAAQAAQARTVSAWGEAAQADMARLKVLVVGVGSVGLDVALRLAASGVQHVGVMDADVVERRNLDRLVGATRWDARLRRRKVAVAARLARRAATADEFTVEQHAFSLCTQQGVAAALDYDVIFSCVDRPWPRAVLSSIAYADLIPVIDGGLDLAPHPQGGILRASARFQTVVPGNPCLACSRQINMSEVTLERQGLLDNPGYLEQAGRQSQDGAPNVAAFSATVIAGLLEQFVVLTAARRWEVGPPIQHIFSLQTRRTLEYTTGSACSMEGRLLAGDRRVSLVG